MRAAADCADPGARPCRPRAIDAAASTTAGTAEGSMGTTKPDWFRGPGATAGAPVRAGWMRWRQA